MQNYVTEAEHQQIPEVTASSLIFKIILSFKLVD